MQLFSPITIILCLWPLFHSQASFAVPSTRYTGVLRHESLQRDQLAKIDIVSSTDNQGAEVLTAILTVQFGDYASKEYISYHFDKVYYQASTGWMVLNQQNQEASVSILNFSSDGFEASLQSNFDTIPSTLIMRADGKVPLKYPLMETVEGDYRGTCNQSPVELQISTFRSIEDTTKVGHAFADYEIRGEFAEINQPVCLGLQCVTNTITSGAYNFYKNELQLNGQQRLLTCEPTPTGMICEGCALARVERASKPLTDRDLMPLVTTAEWSSSTEKSVDKIDLRSLSGMYKGYLHHDRLDEYQLASLNLVALPANDSANVNNVQIAALANLYFGEERSSETLAFRYDPLTLPSTAKTLVFKKPESDVDAIIEITSIQKDVIHGTWYSLLFGRVGTFEFIRGSIPTLPKSARRFGKIHGMYENDKTFINLGVSAVKTPLNTENPFYPLSFNGLHIDKLPMSAKIGLLGGSFDYFTGRIAMFYAEGERFWVGDRIDSDTLRLRRSPRGYGTLTPDFKGALFHRTTKEYKPPTVEIPLEIPGVPRP